MWVIHNGSYVKREKGTYNLGHFTSFPRMASIVELWCFYLVIWIDDWSLVIAWSLLVIGHYLVIAGNFAGLYKVTAWVHSENDESIQTTQGDDDNKTRNVHPHGPVNQTQWVQKGMKGTIVIGKLFSSRLV